MPSFDPIVALTTGLLQGLTEFLPVSSSGHVAIGAWLFGAEEISLTSVVILHAGTLLATLVVLRHELRDLLRYAFTHGRSAATFFASSSGWSLAGVVVASLPTAVAGLLFEERVEQWAQSKAVVGACLCVTGMWLLTTCRKVGDRDHLSFVGYFLVGIAQSVAIMPGISRSGSTIAAAMLLGMKPEAAFRFSFLLSLPAIGGALLLKGLRPDSWASIDGTTLGAGVVAFAVGFVALKFLRRLVRVGQLWMFSLYVIPAGLTLLLWDLLR